MYGVRYKELCLCFGVFFDFRSLFSDNIISFAQNIRHLKTLHTYKARTLCLFFNNLFFSAISSFDKMKTAEEILCTGSGHRKSAGRSLRVKYPVYL